MLKVLKIDTTTHHELPWLPLGLRRSPSVYTRLALYPRKLCPRPITRCQVLRDSQPQSNAVAIKPRRSELGVSGGRAVLGLPLLPLNRAVKFFGPAARDLSRQEVL